MDERAMTARHRDPGHRDPSRPPVRRPLDEHPTYPATGLLLTSGAARRAAFPVIGVPLIIVLVLVTQPWTWSSRGTDPYSGYNSGLGTAGGIAGGYAPVSASTSESTDPATTV